MAEQKLTAAQRMLNFAALTRQNRHMVGKQSTSDELSTIQFVYPTNRLLAQTYVKVDVDINVKHASGTALTLKSNYELARIIRKITQDLNIGFRPVVMSGEELLMFNTIATHPAKITSQDGMILNANGSCTLKSSSAGVSNKYSMVFELKNTLNDSMLQGLILLQNKATQMTLNVDIGTANEVVKDYAGYTATLNKVDVTPMMTTYSVPSDERAFPDISVLRLVQSKSTVFSSGGEHTVYLDTGTIYRKLGLYFTDEAGLPLKDSDITSNIEIAFNTADIPYSVSAEMLRFLNADEFGQRLREGLYVFDFSSQSPLIGYGGTRDYIDTDNLTLFTLKFNTDKACKVTCLTEQLSRLV